jgi:hypothetical protein
MEKIKLWIEKFTEAWTACFLCMVQGDLSVVTMKHAMVAAKTGSLAGIAFVIAALLPWENKWLGIWLTGLFTMIADIIIHPTHFGGEFTESIVTGIVAAAIAFAYEYIRVRKNEQ